MKRPVLCVGMLCGLMLCALAAHALEIEVFTASATRPLPVSGHVVRYYALDAPERLAATLPRLQSRDVAQATAQAQAWIRSQGERHAHAVRNAYQGRVKAMQYGIDRLPAITFASGHYVVYGTTSVVRALHVYYNERDRQIDEGGNH